MFKKIVLLLLIEFIFEKTHCSITSTDKFTDHSQFIIKLSDTSLIRNLALIGTHNSASGENKLFSQIQNLTIKQQLESGIRVLDMCVNLHGDKLVMYYGPVSLNVTFDHVLGQVLEFMKKNSGELIIMLMRIEYDNNVSVPKSKQCNVLDNYIRKWNNRGLLLIKNWSLIDDYIGEHRGHVLLGQYDGRNFVDCTTWLACDIQNHWEAEGIMEVETKWALIKKNFDDMFNPYHQYQSCFINYLTSLDISIFSSTPELFLFRNSDYSKLRLMKIHKINSKMVNYYRNPSIYLVIIMADLPDQELIDKIINSNFY